MIDYHTHTEYSIDSEGLLPEYCEMALDQGLTGLGFSEHVDFDPRDPGCGFYSDLIFSANLNILKTIHYGNLEIFKGVEVTYQPQFIKPIKEFLTGVDTDYVIGSIHFLEDWNISTSQVEEVENFKRVEKGDAFRNYFNELERLVDSKLFDIIGHFDIITRYGSRFYGQYNPDDYSSYIYSILEKILENNMIIEVNTSGFRKGPGTTFPHPRILEMYSELGGDTLVFGSDAHTSDYIGSHFEIARDFALKAGLKYEPVFRDRNIIDKVEI